MMTTPQGGWANAMGSWGNSPSFSPNQTIAAPAPAFDFASMFQNPNSVNMPAGVAGMPQFGATAVPPAAGGGMMGGLGSWLGNGQNLAGIASGLSALTGMYMGNQQLKHAKDALGFQKTAFNTNLNNSVQSYNTSLEDRIRGRTSDYEGKEDDVRSYLESNKLRRSG